MDKQKCRALRRTELIKLKQELTDELPKASHHCHTMGNSNITATRKQNVQFCSTFGHLCAYVGRCVVRFLLTEAGDHYMHKCDGDGVVPDPPPHHRGKQKAAAKVGELQGQEVHWEGKNTGSGKKFMLIVDDIGCIWCAHPSIWSWIRQVRS